MTARKINILKGKVLYDNVLIREVEVDMGPLGNIDQYEDKPEYGEVLAVGEGRMFDNGTLIPPKVKVGDVVLFQKYSAAKVRHEGKDYMFIKEEDIYEIC